jgi:hypothetical protein
MTTEKTLELVRAYYDSWTKPERGYDEAGLRRVLHPKLVFESPTGRREDVGDFLPGLERFTKTLKRHQMLQLFGSGAEAAALYDCDLTAPIDRLRCAEVFRVEGAQIVTIRLVFDATPYKLRPAPAG